MFGLGLSENDAGRREALGCLALRALLRPIDLDVAPVGLAGFISVEVVDTDRHFR
jgi:hypothetical protein